MQYIRSVGAGLLWFDSSDVRLRRLLLATLWAQRSKLRGVLPTPSPPTDTPDVSLEVLSVEMSTSSSSRLLVASRSSRRILPSSTCKYHNSKVWKEGGQCVFFLTQLVAHKICCVTLALMPV